MSVDLLIQERLSIGNPPRFRTRSVTVKTDSVTVGSDSRADVQIKSFQFKTLVEIKQSQNEWWILDHSREGGLWVNGKPLKIDLKLKSGDHIHLDGHELVFRISASHSPETFDLTQAPTGNDEALWHYLLNEQELDEVLINGREKVFVDYRGQLIETPWVFQSNDFLISKIKAASGRDYGWCSWRVNRLLRIHAALPPVAERPHLSIRKAKRTALSLGTLEASGFASPDQMDVIREALRSRANIIISGGTSSGKTSFLRALIEACSAKDRIVILEEEAEVEWPHPHSVSLEVGRGNLRSGIIEVLRMRPDRIIVSEVRGSEAFEMMQALSTGHPGSMTTLHANSPREAILRLESLILSAGLETNIPAIRRMIANSIQLVFQIERDAQGHRKIQQIVEITGLQNETLLLSDPVKTGSVRLKHLSKA